MSGRLLFSLVWLIIAAGLVLPLYPQDVATSTVAAANDPVQLVAATQAAGCEDCPVAAARPECQPDCPCGQVLPAAAASEDAVSFTLFVVVHPQPSGRPSEPQPLPPKLPAI